MKKNYHFLFLIFILLFFVNIDLSAQVTADTVFSGTSTFKVPAGVTQLSVECWGGGGRGARVTTNGGFAGAGGGGGAYSKKLVTVTAGNTYNVIVGAGSSGTGAGGDSYFNTAGTVMAKGGNSCANNATTGATGGAAASGVGDTKKSGGNGADANYASRYGGGGGSSGGLSSDGANGSGASGGTAPAGGGDGGNGRSSTQGVGTVGSIPGGGGGGALSTSNNDYNAGNGAKGQVIITWCVPVSLTGTTAEGTCSTDGTTTVTLTGDTDKLPIGTYTVTYNRSNPAATGLTATMTVTTAGSGTFTATGFTTAGTQTLTVTKLESDWCAWTISANNTANVIVSSSFALTGVSATETCPSDGTITVTTSGNATDLPVGSYTVTYNRSNPAATGLTATMTVSVAGTGTFTGTGFTTAGSPTLTITNLAKGACSNSISSNNVATVNVKTFALTSSSATNTDNCSGSSTVTLNGNAGDLPVGSYTVTYSRSNPSATGLTATMTVSVAGTGTFTATGLTTIGAQTITVTKLEKGSCWNNISANNVANLTVSALLSLTGTSASGACPTFGETTVTLTANAANLPTGNYTVTYNRSNPAATGLTASMTVSVAGTGTFTATGFTVLGSPTITVTNLDKGTCGNSISANNTATVSVKEYALTGSSATNTCSGSTTVTLSANASDLPTGSYTVTYTRSNPYATGLTSTMTVSVAGTGTFTATGYNTTGNQSVTVTKLEKGSCWTNISANNVANFTVTAFSISSLSATSTCAASGSSTVTVTSTAIGLPTGSYTVTYNRSAPAATGLTATMTVSVAGTGTFTATGFTTNGEHTVTVTNLLSGTCSNAITLNNTATVRVLYYFTSAEASSVCTDDGTSNIKLYSTATGLPTGTYTVTYSRSSPAASGLTATMTVDVAGFGQFGVGDLVNAGNQTITITGLNMGGCNSNLSVNNTVPVLVSSAVPAQPSAITGQTYSCVGQSQTYSVTNVAGVTYYWQLPSQWTITAGEFTNSVTCTVGDAGGIIRVTPFNGCTGPSRSLTITQISPSIAITNLSSPCGKDGAIVVTPAGGSGSYSYAWSTGATTSSITNLYKGTYNVTITDNVSGCSKTFVNILGTTSYNNICSTKEGTVTTSGLVNSFYGPSASGTYTAGSNSITLGPIHTSGNSTNFSAGDLALIIQMQGATMDTSNTPSWGTVSNVVAGKYEYVYVSSFNTGTGVLDLSTGLVNTYIQDRANGYTFQVIRVPQYFNLTLNGNLTVLRWRGNATGDAAVGGIIAIDVANNLNFNGKTIDAGGAGFRGGAGYNYGSGSGLGKNTDYSFYSASNGHNYKGEGIAGTPKYIYNGGGTVLTGTDYPHGKGKGRGAAGNAGGAGNDADVSNNDENSGGGGGANVTAGGMGGCPWRSTNFVKDIGGRGGRPFAGSATQIIMGGGGGAGTGNNSDNATAPKGGNGGGIVIIHAKSFSGTGTISVNGSPGTPGIGNTKNDAGGGGGAGGTILITYESSTATLTLNANGGRGSDAFITGSPPADSHGPGGGGSGGAIYTNASYSSPNITYNINGGLNGLTTTNNIPYESKPGDNGVYHCTVPPDDLPTTIFARTCTKDGTPPTISCPSISTCCAGNVPAIFGNLGEYTTAGGTTSDDLSGVACIAFDEETGSEALGTINRLYSIVDSAGNRSSCTHEITVKPTPDAGISGTTTVYRNDPQPLITFTNTTNYNATVTYSVNVVGKAIHTINVPANSTANLSVSTNNEGVYEYKLIDVYYQISPTCTKTFDPPTAPAVTVTVLGALPIELIYLNATRESNYVNLKWATATEINNDFFVVQRSQDGVSFKNIDTVDGAGNSNILLSYSYLDKNPLSGISYYRLKQVDFDGVYSLTNVVSVKEGSEDNIISIYPNPVKRGEFVNILTEHNNPDSKVNIFLKDNNSHVIENFGTLTDSNGNLIFKLPIDEKLKAGVYFIEISCEGKYIATKIVVTN